MKTSGLIDSFSEFKDFKNIDRETLMHILEEVFRTALAKKYGTDDNFDIIINIDKGDLEIYRNRLIVEDGQLTASAKSNTRRPSRSSRTSRLARTFRSLCR